MKGKLPSFRLGSKAKTRTMAILPIQLQLLLLNSKFRVSPVFGGGLPPAAAKKGGNFSLAPPARSVVALSECTPRARFTGAGCRAPCASCGCGCLSLLNSFQVARSRLMCAPDPSAPLQQPGNPATWFHAGLGMRQVLARPLVRSVQPAAQPFPTCSCGQGFLHRWSFLSKTSQSSCNSQA